MDKKEQPRLAYSRKSAAEALDCSLRWLDELIAAGKIAPVKKEGRKILIPEKSLMDFLEGK